MKTLPKCIVAALAVVLSHAAGADVFYKFVPSNGVMKGSATSPVTQSAAAADIIGLWTGTCSFTTLLHGAGACGAVNLGTDVTSTLPLANGGIGATSLAAASIPAFSGSITSGHCVQWLTSATIGDAGAACGAGGATPASPTNSVQFNNSGSFGGSSNFKWDNTNGILTLGGSSGGIINTLSGENLSLIGGNALTDLTSATCSINEGGGVSGAGGSLVCSAGNAVTSGAGGPAQLNGGNAAGTNQGGGPVSMSAGISTGSASNGTASIITHGIARFVWLENGVVQVGGASGSSGSLLTSNGSSSPPTWQNLNASALPAFTGDCTSTSGTAALTCGFKPLSGTTAAIGGSALTPGQCTAGTVTVTGATTSMAVSVAPSADPDSTLSTGIAIYGFVSASNTVTVRVCAIVAVTPASVTYNVRVIP